MVTIDGREIQEGEGAFGYVESIDSGARRVAQELADSFRGFSRGTKSHFMAYFVMGNDIHDRQQAYFLEALGVDPELLADCDPQLLIPIHIEGDAVLFRSSNVYDGDGPAYDVTYAAMNISELPSGFDMSYSPVFESC